MAANPLIRMTAAAAGLCAGLWLAGEPGTEPAVILGMIGPLAAALGTWIVVKRTHDRTPERVSGMMVRLFGVKLVLFAAYVASVVLLLAEGITAFVVSFTCQYILLHVMEAFSLRRLFAPDWQRAATRR